MAKSFVTSPKANSTLGRNAAFWLRIGPSLACTPIRRTSGSRPAPARKPAPYFRVLRLMSPSRSRIEGGITSSCGGAAGLGAPGVAAGAGVVTVMLFATRTLGSSLALDDTLTVDPTEMAAGLTVKRSNTYNWYVPLSLFTITVVGEDDTTVPVTVS